MFTLVITKEGRQTITVEAESVEDMDLICWHWRGQGWAVKLA